MGDYNIIATTEGICFEVGCTNKAIYGIKMIAFSCNRHSTREMTLIKKPRKKKVQRKLFPVQEELEDPVMEDPVAEPTVPEDLEVPEDPEDLDEPVESLHPYSYVKYNLSVLYGLKSTMYPVVGDDCYYMFIPQVNCLVTHEASLLEALRKRDVAQANNMHVICLKINCKKTSTLAIIHRIISFLDLGEELARYVYCFC